MWDEENEIVPLDSEGNPLVRTSEGKGVGGTFWMLWAEEVMGVLEERGEARGTKRGREQEEVGEEELDGRRAMRREG